MLKVDRLRDLLHYNPETGIFTWRDGANLGRGGGKRKPGVEAGGKGLHYTIICIDREFFYAHRLAWLYMTGEWPSATIDHIDRNGFNNKWANLRLATISEQRQNSRLSRRNTSGHKGVSWSEQRQKWCAGIGHNGKRIALGRFDRLEDAVAAYVSAKERMHDFHPQV